MPPGTNGWDEWGKHVLAELERQNSLIEGVRISLNNLTTEVAMLKVKAGMWGFIAGVIPGLIILFVKK